MTDGDILGPSDRRRVWTAQQKATLLAEVDAEGGKVRLVARRHQISESLLYNWRPARRAAAVAMGATEPVAFIPIGLIEGPTPSVPPNPEPVQQPAAAECKSRSIEIRCRTVFALASMPSSAGRLCRGCCVR